jgi:hypothetical protein
MVRGAFFAICLAQADNAQLSAWHSENQNMPPMPDEANGYGARFSVTPACSGPRYGRFEVGRGGHIINAVLGDIGDVLAIVELDRQALIVFTIKCGVNPLPQRFVNA